MSQAQRKIKSKIGPLYIVCSEEGLQGIHWKEQNVPYKTLHEELFEQVEMQLTEYLNGERKKFAVPLDLIGTEFQKRVWSELLKIPYGKTISYKQLAEKINDKNASRAVGTANGKNPVSLIVPCHRVIASDGTLGGYAGGLKIKEHLLQLEGSF